MIYAVYFIIMCVKKTVIVCYGLPHHEQDRTYIIEENVQYYSPL